MLTTDKAGCRILINLLVAHGVERCVLSPGSRNVPLIIAAARESGLQCEVVIDERVAAFMALGMAVSAGAPVALICTSGTAMLNYAPAVAEAYYRHVPLIVVTADRPPQWIDQDDSQTLRQADALSNFVKRSYNLRAECRDGSDNWWVNREINDALNTAMTAPRGPVHINVAIDEPLSSLQSVDALSSERTVRTISPAPDLCDSQYRDLVNALQGKRTLIILGFMDHNEEVDDAISRLGRTSAIAVMSETLANVWAPHQVSHIDSALSAMSPQEAVEMRPDVIISVGGALVSRMIKRFLRSCEQSVEHWYIGISDRTIDCFQHLTRRFNIPPERFLLGLARHLSTQTAYDTPQCYSRRWQEIGLRGDAILKAYVGQAPWSDLVAMDFIHSHLPDRWHLHLSNGTPVRYAQLLDRKGCHTSQCNRGVSGIDGCTSTAVGASLAAGTPTLLITGDMSFQYDIGALALKQLGGDLKIVVMCNGGGTIFRFINSTRSIDELDDYLSVGTNLPLGPLCQAYGIDYYPATSLRQLEEAWDNFVAPSPRASLLAVYTDGQLSAQVLSQYFESAQGKSPNSKHD